MTFDLSSRIDLISSISEDEFREQEYKLVKKEIKKIKNGKIKEKYLDKLDFAYNQR
ncbi:MAG: hypothetical protein Q8P15_01250 [Nanoarchaeota archaeon]|nr:hypothetical protein [Nanoarchaeota archaeon]